VEVGRDGPSDRLLSSGVRPVPRCGPPCGAETPDADFIATDPGVRGGPPGAGGPLRGLRPGELQLFLAGQEVIQEVDSVQGTIPNTSSGLGPRFNMDSCGGCHNHPAPGGSSPPVNPQVAVATKAGATNAVPSFISIDGPIRHAHVLRDPNGTPNGGLLFLYTITALTEEQKQDVLDFLRGL